MDVPLDGIDDDLEDALELWLEAAIESAIAIGARDLDELTDLVGSLHAGDRET